jgi:beta-galactosidase/beta-glucuronidase
MTIPRPEYPRPQFVRPDWLCLNGTWEFAIDQGDSGLERGLREQALGGTITVPFCPESELSGVGNRDFLVAVWYRRTVDIPAAWRGRRVLLHFQAVDHDATVWVNGVEVGRHRGGFTPFSCDLGGVAEPGTTATIVVRARDDHRGPQARGKQSSTHGPQGCHYLRTTGIWQTVWLEPVPESHLGRPRILPDLAAGCFRITVPIAGMQPGLRLRAVLADARGPMATAEVAADLGLAASLDLAVPADRRVLWEPGRPHLYDLVSEFGGIHWNPDARPGEDSWGYGDRPRSLDAFHARFEGLCAVLLGNPDMFGYCYTQLTDVYQEQNGIFRFDRAPKFDLARIRAAQTRPAACERPA